MSRTTHHRIKWISRSLAILFILIISIFALDVFGEGYTWWEMLFALFMHLIPSFLLIVATIVAWRRPALGGVWFVFWGLVSVFFFNTHRDIITFLLISFPAFLIGGLFLWNDLASVD